MEALQVAEVDATEKTQLHGVQGRFPERTSPSHTTFRKVEAKLRTGSFPSTVKHANHTIQGESNLTRQTKAVNPHVSLRVLGREIRDSKDTVHIILKAHGYHPFKIHLSQGLRPNDL
ncbi:hypothetical protein NQ318_003337 [Aromia moschata]|uniref:Uncharacterized protein n=1 Tax=Aromia moschata TaxID=1265417 RepID=A0AAV8XHD5_9CUCU|nr:hypothetical protein NQ318_003337 [Aromia moschata]